ncbi:MAG: hypothetical protein K2K16_11440 [Ruminococcus sp.]|nr:hypothetical protein [Ruminococcus sp.]
MQRKDVDAEKGFLNIKDSKNGCDKFLPLSLHSYINAVNWDSDDEYFTSCPEAYICGSCASEMDCRRSRPAYKAPFIIHIYGS